MDALREFIIKHSSKLYYYEGTSSDLTLPKFDLYPGDYLFFAEQELIQYQSAKDVTERDRHIINCVSNLKRALDCEIEIFLTAYSLIDIFRKKNSTFPQKLEFLSEAGIFSSRTISRLNSIRNRMEHEFEIPEIQDLEIYFDLTSAIVSILERTIPFAKNKISTFCLFEDHDENWDIHITFTYCHDTPAISVVWQEGESEEQYSLVATYNLNQRHEFTFILKVLLLLLQQERFLSPRYVNRCLVENS